MGFTDFRDFIRFLYICIYLMGQLLKYRHSLSYV